MLDQCLHDVDGEVMSPNVSQLVRSNASNCSGDNPTIALAGNKMTA